VDKLTEALKRTGIACESVNNDGKEMIEQLKEKFQPTTHKGEQLQNPNCFTEKLVCKENSGRVLCNKLHGTAMQNLGQGERSSFST
jgi:hypothetical protein